MPADKYNWLILVYYLPPEAGSARVRIWRKMKKLGMVSFRNAVYFLPYSSEHYEITQWLCQEIQGAGGEATLLRTAGVENLDDAEVKEFFRKPRDEEYGELAAAAAGLLMRLEALGKARGEGGADAGAAGMTGLADELKHISKRLAEIRKIDFFSAPGRHRAEEAVERCRRGLRRLQRQEEEPGAVPGQPRLDPARFQNRTWVTRPRPFVDRIATAWAVARFIDPGARFEFAEDPAAVKDAVPYDYVAAELSHQGEDCTFETLVKRFGLKGRGVGEIAEIVHDIDLRDARFARPEAAGVEAVLKGLAAAAPDDRQLLAQGFDLFDKLRAGLEPSGGPAPSASRSTRSARTTKKASVKKARGRLSARAPKQGD